MHRAPNPPATIQNRRLCLSPMDALIDHVVRCRLLCQIPVRCALHPVIPLRSAVVIPQRRPTRRGDARGLWVHPDVIEDLPDIGRRLDGAGFAGSAWVGNTLPDTAPSGPSCALACPSCAAASCMHLLCRLAAPGRTQLHSLHPEFSNRPPAASAVTPQVGRNEQ